MAAPATGTFRAYRVEENEDGFTASVKTLHLGDLPAGEVTVRVAYSSLNYKDALSARGNRGVTRSYPHTPGIDAAGVVLDSSDPRFSAGQSVIVTSYDLGMNTAGGFGEMIRVPADWVVPLPDGLDLREAMILGTAGLTAGLALRALERYGLSPAAGPVVVTGASGGVGSLSVALLAHLGYQVIASTGSRRAHGLLESLGASRILERSKLSQASDRPLLGRSHAGAIDTVGGTTLENLVKATDDFGAVAACGLVGGSELRLTVYPFILRGVALLGIDSAGVAMATRIQVWRKLAGPWKPQGLERLAKEVTLEALTDEIEAILKGRTVGRVLVRVAGQEPE